MAIETGRIACFHLSLLLYRLLLPAAVGHAGLGDDDAFQHRDAARQAVLRIRGSLKLRVAGDARQRGVAAA